MQLSVVMKKQSPAFVSRQVRCRCGHEWFTQLERPKACPQCKSFRWDQPKKSKKGGK